MNPTLLREAFDRLKEIEESDDPFCIGADSNDGDLAEDETTPDWAEPTRHEVEDDDGNTYTLEYISERGKELGFIEVNGISTANFEVGGAGPHSVEISKPDMLIEAFVSLLTRK